MSPPNSRWSSLVFFCYCICPLHICFPFQKKTSSRFLLFLFLILHSCIQFIANPLVNSLQILVRSYLLSELRWQVLYLCNELGHTGLSLSVQPNPFGASEENNSVLPISVLSRHFVICILHICSSSTRWFLSSTSITFYMLLCSVTQGRNLFWLTIQKIPSWKLMSKGERDHINA